MNAYFSDFMINMDSIHELLFGIITEIWEFGLLMVLLIVGGNGQNLSWWQTSIVYQVYPRSFKDSTLDGVGDINGLRSKLDYFTNIGVDSYWLSPVYSSPMLDFGYDISNFTDIDPIFGTLADFDMLVNETHSRGLKIIMDFVPGHTSTEHEWFNKSVNREGNYTNYYVWTDGILLSNGSRGIPNNWLSVFGGPTWTWNDVRKQFYYHAFIPQQADLNYRDPNVQEEMKDVLRFWLDRGVDGFRVDAIEKLYEVENVFLNEPVSGLNVSSFQYEYLDHIYTSNQPETNPTVKSWYDVLKEYIAMDNKDRYMVVELYALPAVRNLLYETGGSPFNFDLIDITPNPTGYEIRDRILNEYDNLPPGKWPNFVLGNHDRRRVSHKYGPQYVDVYNMLLLTLWGTPTTYYGEEIGMREAYISWNQTVDPWGRNYGEEQYEQFSRDPERTPMQWTPGYQAGFTVGPTTWLPLGDNYSTINVQYENETAGMSSLKLYSQLARLRKLPAFTLHRPWFAFVDQNVVSYIRMGGGEQYLVAINVGKMNDTVNFRTNITGNYVATIIAYTPGIQNIPSNLTLNLTSILLRPGDGYVLKLTPVSPGSAQGMKAGVYLYAHIIIMLAVLHYTNIINII
uniref:Glycosyl hydrolase family 13 catalytic domain-containing protein n=1 Tax=Arion vulgaris TaxID=1028688 RepID=A0A0B7ATJ7_9EUPU